MKRIIAVVVLGGLVGSAHASFVDSNTSLTWLNLSDTTNLSYFDVINGTGNTWLADGWRYATTDEANNLLSAYLPSLITSDRDPMIYTNAFPGDFNAEYQADTLNEAETLSNILGGYPTPWGPWGFLAVYGRDPGCNEYHPQPPCEAVSNVTVLEVDGLVLATQSGAQSRSFKGYYSSHMLVRTHAVPIPAAAYLFASALGILGWMRRRKR